MPALLYVAIMLLLTLLQAMLFFAWDSSRECCTYMYNKTTEFEQQMYSAYRTREWIAAILMLIVTITMGYLTYWMFF